MAVAKLWSVNALAIELEINPTSLGRIVARLDPASSVNGITAFTLFPIIMWYKPKTVTEDVK